MSRRSYLPEVRGIVTGTPHFEDAAMGERWPALYELLTRSEVGGKFREPAVLSIYADGGKLKACIHDRYTHQNWFMTLKSAEAILDEIEACLAAGGGDWRAKK